MIVSGHECSSHLLFAASVGACLMVLLGCVTPLTAGELRLGTAAVKITPPLGTPMAGYYSGGQLQGVLDDIYAKAVVFDDGKTKAAMVACDLIGLPRRVVVEARRIIRRRRASPPIT